MYIFDIVYARIDLKFLSSLSHFRHCNISYLNHEYIEEEKKGCSKF